MVSKSMSMAEDPVEVYERRVESEIKDPTPVKRQRIADESVNS